MNNRRKPRPPYAPPVPRVIGLQHWLAGIILREELEGTTVHFMANSRPGDDVTPEQLAEFFETHNVSPDAWQLVRDRIVTEYAFKVGQQPGVVLFLRAASEDEARTLVDSIPIAQQGLVRFELEPLRGVIRL